VEALSGSRKLYTIEALDAHRFGSTNTQTWIKDSRTRDLLILAEESCRFLGLMAYPISRCQACFVDFGLLQPRGRG
jgi:hypothetical protein